MSDPTDLPSDDFGAFAEGLLDTGADDFDGLDDFADLLEEEQVLHEGSDEDLGEDLGEDLEMDGEDEAALAPPVHWPSVEADDAGDLMVELWTWVQQFQRRFPEMVKLPDCWPHHNSLVELLQAVLDHERAAFSDLAPPTAAAGWHLVVRDIEHRIRDFLSELPCREVSADKDTVHQPPGPLPHWRADDHLAHWLEARDLSGPPD